jgi:hypothetical protein
MDELQRRLTDWLSTPIGSLLGLVLVALLRLLVAALPERLKRPKHAARRRHKPA